VASIRAGARVLRHVIYTTGADDDHLLFLDGRGELPNEERAAMLPPAARIEVVQDTYFGTTIADPYR